MHNVNFYLYFYFVYCGWINRWWDCKLVYIYIYIFMLGSYHILYWMMVAIAVVSARASAWYSFAAVSDVYSSIRPFFVCLFVCFINKLFLMLIKINYNPVG